jgi:hypothetical protein
MIQIRANRRYWTGDNFSNRLWWAEMKGKAVLGMSDLTVRENLAGEDPKDL